MTATEASATRHLPAIVIVDADPGGRDALQSALARRFGADYRVFAAESATSGLAILEQLAGDGSEVALIAADLGLPGLDGIEVLERAHAVHPGAARALLVAMEARATRIPFSVLPTIRRATALGRIDLSIVKGWVTPEEWLYPQVQGALSAWTSTHRPHHEVVRVVGERWSAASHQLRDALSRNTVPFGFYAIEDDSGRRLTEQYAVDVRRLPAAIFHDGLVLQQPKPVEVAAALGLHTRPSSTTYDLAIVGAGPAGLAAAVYGASEGLQTFVMESQSIGGQAGSSSMIRNYLGFPRGLSGGELTFRAWEQALLFGVQFAFTEAASGLTARGSERVVWLADRTAVTARAVIVATGVSYRRLGIASLDRFIGTGVFYGAAGAEAPAMAREEVYVVGGANSAGQAALHLARFAAQVTLLVRGESLAAGMSDYLVRQIEATPNVAVRLRTSVVDGRGEQRLQALVVKDGRTGTTEEVAAAALFVLIGAEPRTEWLSDAVKRDGHGFVLTGHDIPAEAWPLERPPLPFETSLPGVFAVGDVRHGSIKRVAEAVGEGSVAVRSVHQHLAEAHAAPRG